MYSRCAQTYRRKNSRQKSTPRNSAREKDRTRLTQLAVCLLLFLFVFLGRGIFPDRLATLEQNLTDIMAVNTDFSAAFSALGRSITGEKGLLEGIETFCVQVFGPSDSTAAPLLSTPSVPPVPIDPVVEQERLYLCSGGKSETLQEHFLCWNPVELPDPSPTETVQIDKPKPEAVPAVGTVLAAAAYSGQPLPENYTMDHISLGALETVCPVFGTINSPYGYRDHPINGEYLFHGGLDIGGQTGEPIRAFAAGTVDYVGEDDSYGLYLQLDHGNGIKSFYAHCSSVCVRKGQPVALGEEIAQVGSSGSATGPHLHFELKYNSLRLDPGHYILSSEATQ